MEERENFGAVNVVGGNEVPVSFQAAPRIDNNLDFSMATVPVSLPETALKKKRGRPRKYGPDGKPAPGAVTALSPMPISSSIPLTGEFSAWKRGRGKPVESMKKSSFKFDFESPPVQVVGGGVSEGIAYSVGANFTAYVLTVNSGEDVTMKIMSSQQGSRAICILSATGTISNVTLRQSTSSGGTLTYEIMSNPQNDPLSQAETTCGSLLYELQIIWDEVGEAEPDRDRMLFELEQECLEVYRRKVDQANKSRAQLRQAIADCEAELAAICSAMGERPVHIRQSDQNAGSLKEEYARILPQLEEMKKHKLERRNQFTEVQEQIQSLSMEIYGPKEYSPSLVDETDLSLRKLEDLHRQLNALQNEKIGRLKTVQEHLCTLNSLCLVLGFNFKQTVLGIHPSLGDEGPKSVSNDTIQQLAAVIQQLREIKLQRMQKLQDLATTMLELWNLMDTPIEEQQMFQNVTCNIAASEDEITEPNTLSEDFINCVEVEVSRLEELKSSKMKELVLKKRTELEEICRKTHLVPEIDGAVEYAVEAIESGIVDPACVLEQFERQVAQVKEEALGRKDILEKVEKWLAACNEESWLEEYNRDDNRYNAGRGAHLTLKRAEKARGLVNKIPGMVDALTSKTIAWEKEKGFEFTYDGIRLLSMIEEYNILRQEKEQERRRQRDLKKLQGQMIAEQEALYGSKPSPSKPQSVKKGPRMSTGGAASRRVSMGGAMLQTPKPDSKATHSRAVRKVDKVPQFDQLSYPDDGVSCLSSARRGLDIAGIPAKKHSLGAASAYELESPLTRQPFSPLSSNNVSSKANVANAANEHIIPSEKLPKTMALNNMPFVSPCKAMTAADQENRTPKTVPIPIPATPSTASIPMNMTMTPVPSSVSMNVAVTPVPSSATVGVCDVIPVQEIEYSFEERRLAYYMLA